jgi:hypothetical protein
MLPPDFAPGQSLELLKALHILTREGALNQDSRRKLKQVKHLCQFIAPLLTEVAAHTPDFTLADHGAGKSYLGFLLYDLYLRESAAGAASAADASLSQGRVVGIETRSELVERARALADQLSFTRMQFLNLPVAESMSSPALPARVEIVTALHACDTATDDAIRFALAKCAQAIVLVPCCQAEVASVLRANKNASFGLTPLSEMWRHPIHSRELGSHLSNVLRCLLLEASGYQVTVTELVGWEHSMKNELIVARYTGQARGNAIARIEAILTAFNLTELRTRFLP